MAPMKASTATRQVEIAKHLFAAMGIAREDAGLRQDW